MTDDKVEVYDGYSPETRNLNHLNDDFPLSKNHDRFDRNKNDCLFDTWFVMVFNLKVEQWTLSIVQKSFKSFTWKNSSKTSRKNGKKQETDFCTMTIRSVNSWTLDRKKIIARCIHRILRHMTFIQFPRIKIALRKTKDFKMLTK